MFIEVKKVMQIKVFSIVKVQKACMIFDIGLTLFECRMRYRKSAIERALSQKKELYGHKVKQTALCVYISELSKAQGAGQHSAGSAQAHAPICTIRSTCDQSRRITTACAPAPVGCYQGRDR
jgi:hypothetical protein